MPEYIAQKTFLGRFGQMHRGMTYTLPEHYGRQLMTNGLVRIKAIERAPLNVAHEGAPQTLGEDTADPQVDGPGKPSSVSPQARRSRRRTATTQNLGPGAITKPKSS